jgi:hypothetical protein
MIANACASAPHARLAPAAASACVVTRAASGFEPSAATSADLLGLTPRRRQTCTKRSPCPGRSTVPTRAHAPSRRHGDPEAVRATAGRCPGPVARADRLPRLSPLGQLLTCRMASTTHGRCSPGHGRRPSTVAARLATLRAVLETLSAAGSAGAGHPPTRSPTASAASSRSRAGTGGPRARFGLLLRSDHANAQDSA